MERLHQVSAWTPASAGVTVRALHTLAVEIDTSHRLLPGNPVKEGSGSRGNLQICSDMLNLLTQVALMSGGGYDSKQVPMYLWRFALRGGFQELDPQGAGKVPGTGSPAHQDGHWR